MTKDILRRCIFRPYRKGQGPVFHLTVWDTHRRESHALSRCYLGYQLRMDGKVLFEGDEYSPGPLMCIDSDNMVADLMGWLTLRPGDTDKEYFADYTQEQLDYCAAHAEALSCEVANRYGEQQ